MITYLTQVQVRCLRCGAFVFADDAIHARYCGVCLDRTPHAPLRLNAEELGHHLNIDPRTVKRLARQGAIPGMLIGGQWRFDLGEVENHCKRKATEKPDRLSAA
jgi:hypothetical protein